MSTETGPTTDRHDKTLGSRASSSHSLFEPVPALWASIVAGAALAIGFFGFRLTHEPGWLAAVWISLGIGMVYGGRAALEALVKKTVDIDVLMVVGAAMAAAIGHPEEGALLLVLFSLSGALEGLASLKTQREIRALHKLMPHAASVRRAEAWETCDPMTLVAGDLVLIKPGDRVPADAVVVSGSTTIDQSAMTGESAPRNVTAGDMLYSGTINTDDPIEARITRPASESSLQRVLDLVLKASEQRAATQRVIDNISGPYAVGVLIASAAIVVVWWMGLGRDLKDAAYTAITFLIVCSPCALIIATPTATLAGIARAARDGVMFKGGDAIERLARIRAVCFDKTGTLTLGRPTLEDVRPIGSAAANELLAVAAGLESASTHPIATAILAAASDRAITPTPVERLSHTTGRGLSGFVAGVEVRLGSLPHVEPIITPSLRAQIAVELEIVRAKGKIAVVIARATSVSEGAAKASGAALLILTDTIRPGAHDLVRRLHALGVRPVVMLTGDNRTTAAAVADELGLDRFEADLLPEDKLRFVRELSNSGKGPRVALVGDGVNDAPALAAADVSLAIGSIGSDAALESADIVLMSDDLAVVPWAMAIARRIIRTVQINLILALSVIAVMACITLVASIRNTPIAMGWGVVAHEGGTLIVVAHSLLLLGLSGSKQGTKIN